MFSLLRRSTKKKKKSTPEKSPKAARYSAREAEQRADCETPTNATRSIERYRSYNEWQRERDSAREKERALNRQRRELPTQAYTTNKTYTRAEIKEFDDLKDLEEDENDYCDDDDGARSEESGLANARRKALFRGEEGGGGMAARGDGCVYFRSQRVDGKVEENLNLAKTTAANNTKLSNATTDAIINKQASEQIDTAARGGRRAAAASNTPKPMLPNNTEAVTFRYNDFKFNACDVDKINKFTAKANKLHLSKNDDDDDGYECAEVDRGARSLLVRDQTDCYDCETLAAHASPNEEAGWQRRFLSFAKTKKFHKNDRFAKRSINDLTQRSKSVYASKGARTGIGNVESVVETSASFENRFVDGRDDTLRTNVTPNALANNEVKYRNLGNSQKNTTTGKVQKSAEAKRQSRLSLTLGLNLTGSARSKSITDVSRPDSSSISGADSVYYSGTSSCSGLRDQPKRSQFGKAFRYSFLRGRSKSSDTETPSYEDETTQVQSSSGALKKSKDFLSDLFMARGRNHNRNRQNQQTHAQNNSTPRSAKAQPTQQQQQQQLSQQQQNLAVNHQQQTTTKDAHTLAPVNTTTILMNNTHPHHNYKQQNNHNNSSSNTNPAAVMQNVQNNSASTHLEVISDPLVSSTNSYQATMSNNSAKNSTRTLDNEERQRRSNSAGAQKLSMRAALNDLRSHSAGPHRQWSVSEDDDDDGDAGAQNESQPIEAESTDRGLPVAGNSACGVISEVGVELNGTLRTAIDSAKQANVASEPWRSNNTNQTETGKVVDEEECEIESEEEGEEKASVCESVVNSEVRGKSYEGLTEICSKASEAQYSAYTVTTTTGKVPTNSENNERETFDLPPPSTSVYPRAAPMGQTSAKLSETAPNARASTSREFETRNRSDVNVTVEDVDDDDEEASVPVLPKITVVDCSSQQLAEDSVAMGSSPMEHEIFYDFENETALANRQHAGVEICDVDEASDQESDDVEEDDEVFHEQEIPTTIYQQQKWPLRYNHTKLENVPEQEENEEERESDAANDTADSGADSDSDAAMADDALASKINRGNNLDTEYERSQQHFDSTDHGVLKSANTSDSNLSNSYPDSGISGMDSRCSSTSRRYSGSDNETPAARSTKSRSPTMQQPHHYTSNSNNQNNYLQQQQQRTAQLSTSHQRSPFARDGNSTDCDDTLLQCDDLEYVAEVDTNERLVCIESISLPDVVMESTTGASVAQTSASSASTVDNGYSDSGGSEQVININGATGNTIGNVHFIPIRVEGSDQSTPKRRSVDDSVLGSGKTFAHMNGVNQKSTIEITEDGSELTLDKHNGYNNSGNNNSGNNNSSSANDAMVDKLRRELIEQKSRHNTQIGDAQKNVQNLQDKVAGMQGKIEKLEQELSAKAWNVERLQSELQAAQTDDDFVRKRLKLLEEEKTSLRHKYSENEDEFRRKYEELETQYNELEAKYKETKQLASNLQTQLAAAQSEAEEWRKEVEKIRGELEAQITILKNALENSEAERKICQDKWQKEFEMLRTQNRDREETVMNDCEWQLRQVQRQAKEKNDKLEQERQLTALRAESLQCELEERKQEVEGLKVYQAEVKSLRGVVAEQELAIKTLMQQIDNMKGELETAHTNLEEQMKAVKKIKHQCDNALRDKEREVVYRINEVRNQAAVFWEDKLYTEMTRLKNELEAVYVDERRDALDKLQAEHIEELRALTTRYTANEDELRTELNELQERFERKSEEFIDLREKSDNNLLQMRMHLDRADREYQKAMCLEEERKEALEENLRKEFQAEREEMEEKFRERLSQVKEEFAKELQDATQDMRLQFEKELAQQKAKIQVEKEEALQELSERHRKKLAAVEEKIKDIELRHQHDLKDLKAAYDTEKAAMDRRDISNSNEIQELHRKCRCLTNLFEEMRMRYERRDPRQEDLREIEELRSRCESQERDLYDLTDRLREMQIQMSAMQATNGDGNNKKVAKQVKKPPPKTIPTNCDVIYEDENEEEGESTQAPQTTNNEDVFEQDEEQKEESDSESPEKAFFQVPKVANKQSKIIHGNPKTANLIISSKKINQKNVDTVNEEDESHMITAM